MSLMGQMMNMPLLISSLLTHAARHNGDTEIVSKRVEGDMHRTTWAEVEARSRKLAQALARLGCEPGDRVGTLAWNGYRHLEIYYGTSGSQLVCHTVNPRLFPQQIAWIVNDAQDKVLFVDINLLPLVEKLIDSLKSVQAVVLMAGRENMPRETSIPKLLCYEDLIDTEDGQYHWPEFDENAAATICYTSGTTGNPKGAVYSHRSTVLHAMAAALPDAMCLKATDTVLPVVPMFHVNAWGIPYAAALVGCKLVMPGHHLDGASLYQLFEDEQVTISAGVPTIWLGLLNHVKQNNLRFSSFRTTIIGGAACPPAMIRAFENDYDVEVVHAWGMTELSPIGTLGRLKSKHADLPAEHKQKILEKQGKSVFGIDMRIVNAEGDVLPWDGKTSGDLEVRGHWVIQSYFNVDKSPLHDGWFPTGDVATIDPDGYMQITDRSKDVIKSGGEWISSIDLENAVMAHPAVHEAAVIAAHHPKWDERPLLVVVKKPGVDVTREELLAFYEGKIPRWQVPDDVVFVTEIPHTATGKIYKLGLREQFKDHKLPGDVINIS
ncbi:MAG: fatty-acid--CoA ligase [Burkholderiales bacterium]|nr:fatty-acid--CoA ligase [Burkholderiales bacterium]MDE2431249.1 fatty-acid--CoA ligase [Burkholderiales bacterium]